MNFKFKLSRRLAGMKSVAFMGLALVGACSSDLPVGPHTRGQPSIDTTTHSSAPVAHTGYFVTPDGSATGDGSVGNPWDLATALAGGNGRLQPGDTVWMHGGTYAGFFTSTVAGAPDRPVVFRQYPGEHATIDGTLRANGADVVFWGFEVMRSAPSGRLAEVEARGARQKYINLVIHDGAQQGMAFWDEAVNSVMYGCVVYNNGTHENLDHGAYVHNLSGSKLMKDNVFFNNLAWGIQIYSGPGEGVQRDITLDGNVSFNNGTISAAVGPKGNIIVGNTEGLVGMRVINNLMYFSGNQGRNLWLGWTASNQDVTATGNVAYGGGTALVMGSPWASATIQNNTFGGADSMVDLRGGTAGFNWSGNTFYRDASAPAWMPNSGSSDVSATPLPLAAWQSTTGLSGTAIAGMPTTTQVFVRRNDYEGGRALIVVYNFGHEGSVSADISGIGLGVGQHYEVVNVQDLYGAPVASGTYGGGSISLPMTGVTPPPRLGRSTAEPPRTGPDFDVFEIVPIG